MLRMCIFLRDSSCLSANCMVVKSLNSSRELSTWINSLEYNAMEIYFYVCWLTEALHKYCCWHLLFHSGGKYTPKSLIVPQNNKIIAGKHFRVLSQLLLRKYPLLTIIHQPSEFCSFREEGLPHFLFLWQSFPLLWLLSPCPIKGKAQEHQPRSCRGIMTHLQLQQPIVVAKITQLCILHILYIYMQQYYLYFSVQDEQSDDKVDCSKLHLRQRVIFFFRSSARRKKK